METTVEFSTLTEKSTGTPRIEIRVLSADLPIEPDDVFVLEKQTVGAVSGEPELTCGELTALVNKYEEVMGSKSRSKTSIRCDLQAHSQLRKTKNFNITASDNEELILTSFHFENASVN